MGGAGGGKLRRALRHSLTVGAASDWLDELSELDPRTAEYRARAEPPENAELPPGAGRFWSAFWILVNDRTYAMTGEPYPIPFSAIDAYGRRMALEGTEFERFVTAITAMDEEYRAVICERIAAAHQRL
ncbi:MAG: hypothetical protein KBC46_03495 [Ferrovibrio sp.]|nr:hypothetical protein [Ferrovibrio sp.]